MSDRSTPSDPSTPSPTELDGLANALRVLLLLAAVLSAALAYLAVRMRAALDDVTAETAGAAQNEVDAFFGGASVYFLALAGIGVLFVVWLWRAARNNRGFGRPGALGPGWAIGGWFIPIGSLVIPGLLVQQLWKGADSTVPPGDAGWRRVPANVQVWCWWLAYVAAQGLTFVGFTLVGQSEDPQRDLSAMDLLSRIDDVRLGVTLFVAGQLLMIVAAALGVATVVDLSRRQAVAASELRADGGGLPEGWAAAARPAAPAAWLADPTGRYDLRYWDGLLWTEHVTRDGDQATDPV